MNRNLSSQFHPVVRDYPAERAGGVEGSVVGMVPTDKVWGLREADRRDPTQNGYSSNDNIDTIRKDLRSGVGINEPLVVNYDHRNQHAWLGEGNHRLRAAVEEGIPEVPVRVERTSYGGDVRREHGIGLPATHRPEAEYSPGYVSSSLHPSMLQFGEKPKSDIDHIQDLLRPSWQQ